MRTRDKSINLPTVASHSVIAPFRVGLAKSFCIMLSWNFKPDGVYRDRDTLREILKKSLRKFE